MQELSDMDVDAVAGGIVIGVIVMGPLVAAVAQATQQIIQEQQKTGS